MDIHFDMLIAGGGINGAAIARDAAGRGLKVLLVEKDDLAAHTSSASTKLIHGGLRYLEQYEFRLIREALAERERLIRAAPHLVRPLEFVLPHDRKMRPRWMIRLGLFIYDHLGGRSSLPRSHSVKLAKNIYGAPLRQEFTRGFSYYDCWGDDSRLVVANARDAKRLGAKILTRTELLQAERISGDWRALLALEDGRCLRVTAKSLVNATGAWAGSFGPQNAGVAQFPPLQLIKGSHIVTRRLFEGNHAYILQNPDNRIVFAIPYERDFTLIGTTDIPWHGSPERVTATPEEIEYLCGSVNRWLNRPITPEQAIWTYAGLRALYGNTDENPSELSRDYILSLDDDGGEAPLLNVYGGKITTHRALAEHALTMFREHWPDMGSNWTSDATLPGGEFGPGGLDKLVTDLQAQAPFIERATLRRWALSYGSEAHLLLDNVRKGEDLGRNFGAGLTEREIERLMEEEWAMSGDDILWRRSKLGLHLTQPQQNAVKEYVESRVALRQRAASLGELAPAN